MNIAVFCGANTGTDPAILQAAQAMGRTIAQRGMGVVYGGGHVGLMGAVADAALEAGGRVIGVIPGFMMEKELAHQRLTELRLNRSPPLHLKHPAQSPMALTNRASSTGCPIPIKSICAMCLTSVAPIMTCAKQPPNCWISSRAPPGKTHIWCC